MYASSPTLVRTSSLRRSSSGSSRGAFFQSVISFLSIIGVHNDDETATTNHDSRTAYVYDTCVVVDCAQWLDAMASCAKVNAF